MTTEIPPYTPLETSVTDNLESAIELLTKETDIDRIDLDPRFSRSPVHIEMLLGAFQGITQTLGYSETEAWQTAYRACLFSFTVAELVGTYDFQLGLPVPTGQYEDLFDQMWADGLGYIQPRPAISGLIDAFMDEIDLSGTERFASLGRIVAANTFLVIENDMHETYLQAASTALS